MVVMRITKNEKRTTITEADAEGNGILLFIVDTDLYFIFPYFGHHKSQLLSLYFKIPRINKEKMKCTPLHALDKKEINRICMAIYQKEKMTPNQKLKVKEQDKKHSAKHHLENKLENQIKKESARKCKRKIRSYQEIPTEPEKFRKHVKKVFSIAGKCPVKT